MKNEKFLSIFFTAIFFLIFSVNSIFAESSYVLPYPSSMPGNSIYKLHVAWEKVMKYWYFGSFGQFDYNLKLSDKYLVEAKTLFEYKQYLLAYQALQKSNLYFKNTKPYLEKSKRENKNIEQKQNILIQASLKHMEELNYVKSIVPENFLWTPEKSSATNLNLKSAIEESIKIRKNVI